MTDNAGERSSNAEEPVDDLDEAAAIIPFTYSITAYAPDYPLDSFFKFKLMAA